MTEKFLFMSSVRRTDDPDPTKAWRCHVVFVHNLEHCETMQAFCGTREIAMLTAMNWISQKERAAK